MALVSPGQQITIIDDSQYVSSAVGTVPFILLATAQDKTFQGLPAAYTSKANAGQLLSFSSQRDLITNLGYPLFKTSSAGTPLNAYETNEYGLMAGYSALGVSNKAFAIRADIDLAQLEGTAIRPIGLPANGTTWLDTVNSTWGIYEWNSITQSFTNKLPTVITETAQSTPITVSNVQVLFPESTVGSIGSYAVVAGNSNYPTAVADNGIFYKNSFGNWVQVGGADSTSTLVRSDIGLTWQTSLPAVVGGNIFGISSPTITGNVTINGNVMVFSGNTLGSVISTINAQQIPGVVATSTGWNGINDTGYLEIFVTSAATSEEANIVVTTASSIGITSGIYAAPKTSYSGYAAVPSWRTTDPIPRPTGSVWFKTSTLGGGANIVLSEFNANSDSWTPIATPIYASDADALYALDPVGGGNNIAVGTVYIKEDALSTLTGSYEPMYRRTSGALKVIGTNTVFTASSFTANDTFTVETTVLDKVTGIGVWQSNVVTIATTGAASSFVNAIINAQITGVTATIESTGAISISHINGGSIRLYSGVGVPLTTAGFIVGTLPAGTSYIPGTTNLLLSNFAPLTYTYSATTPYTAPVDGTLWFYNSPLDVDIMINDNGWKGYHSANVTTDARGYTLSNTDPLGPIMAPVVPTIQTDGTPLVGGDLWINTGDLANFPVISRYDGTTWTLINNTDSIDQNGIVFADARWSVDGTIDPAAGTMSSITSLLTSDNTDPDAPDYRLYPRGTLLFNTRRSGYNVKHYVSNYFNATAFPTANLAGKVSATWVTSSGLMNNGAPYMGSAAQRSMVVKALKAAIAGSDTLREESFQFNLITCPGYPELIPDMVNLNNDRKNTAFVIGDTPMNLAANSIDVTNWSTDANGDGLATADPYMGVYYPAGLTTDLSGNNIVVPPSHMVLRAAIKSDNVSYPWFAFAGTRRGLVDNCSDIGYVDANSGEFVRNGINQGMRDTLYPLAINPITLLSGVGLTVIGNKTRVGVASSLDRVNVARLVNYIRTILASVGNAYLFEPDDKTTWDSVSQVISSALNDLVTKRGIYDYSVVCDSSNNTPDRVARNELYVDIAIEPEKDVEFIYIPIRLMNPGTIASGGK